MFMLLKKQEDNITKYVKCSAMQWNLGEKKIVHLFEFLQIHKTSKYETADQSLNVLPRCGMEVWSK